MIIGTGPLSWDGSERRSDRYGFVCFTYTDSLHHPIGDPQLDESVLFALEGKHGRLIARVIKTRKSTHVGDIFHKVYPITPKVGEEIVLGVGYVRIAPPTCTLLTANIGVQPSDKRATLWMDLCALYRAHEQTVELRFEECPVPEIVESSPFNKDVTSGMHIVLQGDSFAIKQVR